MVTAVHFLALLSIVMEDAIYDMKALGLPTQYTFPVLWAEMTFLWNDSLNGCSSSLAASLSLSSSVQAVFLDPFHHHTPVVFWPVLMCLCCFGGRVVINFFFAVYVVILIDASELAKNYLMQLSVSEQKRARVVRIIRLKVHTSTSYSCTILYFFVAVFENVRNKLVRYGW